MKVDNLISVMIPTIIISVITFVLVMLSILFFPHIRIGRFKLDTYWIIALVGAIILLSFGFAPIQEVGNQLISSSKINPIKILILFFSMTTISVILDELGLFRFLASVASSKAKENQFVLFIVLYVLTAVLTVFTSNDVVILTLTPFICFLSVRSKVNPIPYLVAEFVAANTWSLMLLIGNPTNIYLATSNEISFIDYFKVMAVPTLVGGVVELGLLILIFHRFLKQPLQSNELVYHIHDKPQIIIGLIDLAVCLIFLVISSYLNIEMWLVSAICAWVLVVFMLVYSIFVRSNFAHVKETFRRLPYQLIPFFLSMFIIVVALNSQGISTALANLLGEKATIWAYGLSSFLTSNLINNIPMSILFVNIISSMPETLQLKAIYASIIGSNIGAFLTPIGALAGIMFSGLVSKNNIRFRFIDFIKYGAIISIPVLATILAMTQLFV